MLAKLLKEDHAFSGLHYLGRHKPSTTPNEFISAIAANTDIKKIAAIVYREMKNSPDLKMREVGRSHITKDENANEEILNGGDITERWEREQLKWEAKMDLIVITSAAISYFIYQKLGIFAAIFTFIVLVIIITLILNKP